MAVRVLDLLGVNGCSDCQINAWLGIDNLEVLYLDLELLVEGRAVVVNSSGSIGALIGRFPFDDGLARAGYEQFCSKGYSMGDDNQQCPADKEIENHICNGVF